MSLTPEDVAVVLAEHVALGDEDDGITQCSCGVIAIWRRDCIEVEDDVRYLSTHAEGPDLRWHIAHVAEQIAALVAVREAAAVQTALLSAAETIDAWVPNKTWREDCRVGYCTALDDAATELRDRAALRQDQP